MMSEEIVLTGVVRTTFSFTLGDAPSGLRRGIDRLGVAQLGNGYADIATVARRKKKRSNLRRARRKAKRLRKNRSRRSITARSCLTPICAWISAPKRRWSVRSANAAY